MLLTGAKHPKLGEADLATPFQTSQNSRLAFRAKWMVMCIVFGHTLHLYCSERQRPLAGSLSSLDSFNVDEGLTDYLEEWGSEFDKLEDLCELSSAHSEDGSVAP